MIKKGSYFLAFAIALVGLSGGSIHLQAQKTLRIKSRHSKASATPPSSIVRAGVGDSLTSIAKRTSTDAIQLARLNGLSLNSKLRPGQRIVIPASAVPDAGTRAETRTENGKLISFVDGSQLHVDEAWMHGEEVWYRRGKLTEVSVRKVKSIEPVFIAQVEKTNPQTPAPVLTSQRSSSTPARTWIYLIGGAKFKVDEVKETADGAWYQRGNLVSFLERGRIGRIEIEAPEGANQSGWQEAGWTSGNSAIDQSIRTNGRRFGVDPYLVFLVIEQESHFRTRVVSPKGARGLMQLMPGTARRFAVRNSFDPAENIRGGTQYLKELLTMFNGRVDLALASYNAGEGRVISYGNKVPPFQETQNYVKRIGQRYKKGGSFQKDSRRAPALRISQPTLAEEAP